MSEEEFHVDFDVVVEHDVIVPTRDGTGLTTDIYRPARDGRVLDGPLPTLLSRTHYGKSRWQAEGDYQERFTLPTTLFITTENTRRTSCSRWEGEGWPRSRKE